MQSADVLIAGAGPAGLTAALALRERGLSVSIVASINPKTNAVELVSPQIKNLLAKVHADSALNAETTRPSFGVSAAWGIPQPRLESSLTNPFGPALAIDRSAFDGALLQLAADRGVKVVAGSVEGIVRAEGRLRVRVQGRDPHILNSTALIDATGRRAFAARQLGARRVRFDTLCSFSAEIPSEVTEQAIHVEACEFGWWYFMPTHRGTVLVSFLTDAQIATGLGAGEPAHWFELFGRTQLALSQPRAHAPAQIMAQSCHTSMLNPCTGENWLAVGDAALVFDPLGSAGVIKAIDTGIRGAQALHKQLNGETDAASKYDEWIRRATTTFLGKQRGHYALERRWPNAHFWAPRRRPTSPYHESARPLRHQRRSGL